MEDSGRVGDSPILGAGLYVDNDVGVAGSTGRGEANLYNLCSFLIVEQMRRGTSPKDAGMEALQRIKANTVEKRLLNSQAIRASTSASTRSTSRATSPACRCTRRKFAVCTQNGPETRNCEPLLPRPPE